jgi:nicotinate-nucleotide pyrophosphorylase (carboxylating)
MFIPRRLIEEKLKQLLAEDVGMGDLTASTVIEAGLTANAIVLAKQAGTVAGIEEATILAEYLGLQVQAKVVDGEEIVDKQVLMQISGDAQTILCAERTLLNLLSRMCGIATTTKKLTAIAVKTNPKSNCSTSKSAPGLLYFDKKAVSIGGVTRIGCIWMIGLIKDNHIRMWEALKKQLNLLRQRFRLVKK